MNNTIEKKMRNSLRSFFKNRWPKTYVPDSLINDAAEAALSALEQQNHDGGGGCKTSGETPYNVVIVKPSINDQPDNNCPRDCTITSPHVHGKGGCGTRQLVEIPQEERCIADDQWAIDAFYDGYEKANEDFKKNNYTGLKPIIGGIRSLLAAIPPKRESLSQWHPIETAPKDGTHILVFWNDKVKMAKWSLIKKRLLIFLDQGYSSTNFYGEPTHWMPLPEIPRRG